MGHFFDICHYEFLIKHMSTKHKKVLYVINVKNILETKNYNKTIIRNCTKKLALSLKMSMTKRLSR